MTDEKNNINTQCPACKKKTVYEYRPFCSDKCKKIDLGNWFLERYKINNDEKNNQS